MLDAVKGEIKALELAHAPSKLLLTEFLSKLYALGASDIRMQSNDFVWADINRVLRPATTRKIDHSEMTHIFRILADPSAEGVVNGGEDVNRRVELQLSPGNVLEFRLNAVTSTVAGVKDGLAIVMRSIPKQIPTLEQLQIEEEIVENLFPRYGLILVVGTTGSGKSTLLASSLRHRLENRRHDPVTILTYENPIEYPLHGYAKGYMPEPSQVEIGLGRHLKDFGMATPNAMRRRGDVIVTGEVKDVDSASACLEMSRTGHSVMATLHVDTPAQAFDRLVKFYPMEAQQGEAFAILDQIRIVIAQKLCRTTDGGKIAFRSWCVFNHDLKSRLAKEDVRDWSRFIADTVREQGNTFEDAAFRALSSGHISEESFREVAGMTPAEARNYLASRRGGV